MNHMNETTHAHTNFDLGSSSYPCIEGQHNLNPNSNVTMVRSYSHKKRCKQPWNQLKLNGQYHQGFLRSTTTRMTPIPHLLHQPGRCGAFKSQKQKILSLPFPRFPTVATEREKNTPFLGSNSAYARRAPTHRFR